MVKSLRRASPTKAPLKRYHIFCEGKNTEPEYFKGLESFFKVATIEILLHGGVGAPQTIAAKANDIRKRNGKRDGYDDGDEVWAVFDRDQHPQYAIARNLCRRNGINVAYSDPCFELWLILHFHQVNAPHSHHEIQKKFEDLDPSYKRTSGKRCNFGQLAQGIELAEANAAAMLKARNDEGSPEGCPSTTVHLLTAKLRGKST